MLKDFGSATANYAEKSATLMKQLERLEDEGWVIKKDAGSGSWCNSKSKTIVIGMGQCNTVADVLGVLAHEAGHAEVNP